MLEYSSTKNLDTSQKKEYRQKGYVLMLAGRSYPLIVGRSPIVGCRQSGALSLKDFDVVLLVLSYFHRYLSAVDLRRVVSVVQETGDALVEFDTHGNCAGN